MADTELVSIRGAGWRIGTRMILEDVTMTASAGEIVGLLGPSGAGKTTLVRLVAGTEPPTSGEVTVMGTKMPDLRAFPKIGYMAQSDSLYLELTGRENMEFFGSLYELSTEKLAERILATATLVGLAKDLDRPVLGYSGGMKRRISLAITLLHEPTVLILDEPTVGIDPLLRRSIWQALRKIAAAGTAILVTTHVMDEAEKCDRIGMIRDGRLIALGTPQELIAQSKTTNIEGAFLHFAEDATAEQVVS